ncbi:MAG: carboxypeptidase regulatory-like domain-containing protein [Acidobacteriota bacterium]|nr:carboxypeptidase regulatory-like domain-containing protein [Acidobacteriota bacterium]
MNSTKQLDVIASGARLVVIVITLSALSLFAHGQVSGGSVSGTIKDATQAVVPNASVSIENVDTGVKHEQTSNRDGEYVVPNLQPGNYTISCSAAGFSKAVLKGIAVGVGSELVIDLTMTLGQVTNTISVESTAPVVELSDTSVSQIVSGNTVRELPLNGRDWTLLATLQPGVAQIEAQPAVGVGNDRGNRGLGVQLAVGGNRPQANNYRLDGISISDYSNGAPGDPLGITLGVDAIKEFSVITNDAPASYGRTSGGIVNATTRSGTNKFHGSAYEFVRNSALDARNYFDGPTIPSFSRNQFGGTAGGPVVKDKTFIFGDYEGIRQNLGLTAVSTVLSPNARNGVLVGGTVAIDPTAKKYLAFYPSANGAINGDTGIFSTAFQQIASEDFFTTRVDQTISKADSIFGTYVFDRAQLTQPDNYQLVTNEDQSGRQEAIIEETHIFNSEFVNTIRLGLNRSISDAPKTLNSLNPLAADPSYGFLPTKTIGTLQVTGLNQINGGVGSIGEYAFYNNSYQLYDDAYLTQGKHTLKFGGSFERIQLNQQGRATPSGQFTFASIHDFLTNVPSNFTSAVLGSITPRDLRTSIIAGYIDDGWRIFPNLTLNLGVRYEMSTVPTESKGKLTNLQTITATAPVLGSPYFSNPTKKNFEPRLGFAWDPFKDSKTSVRGAVGMYDQLPLPSNFLLLSVLSAPYFQYGTIPTPGAGTFSTGAYNLLSPSSLRYALVQTNPARSYSLQYNVNVQRQLTTGLSAMIGYAGSHAIRLPYQDNDVNYVQPAKVAGRYVWPVGGTRINPALGQIQTMQWNSSSIYNAMLVQVTQKTRHGVQANVSYTWSKATDTGSSSGASGVFGNSVRGLWFDPGSREGRSDFDVPRVLVLNYVWEIPGAKTSNALANWASNGWQWGGIFHASDGIPFTPTISGDPLGMKAPAGSFDFPDFVGGSGCGSLVNPRSVLHYVNTQCFAFPTPQTLGNATRGMLRGPGIEEFDTSLFKNTRLPRISENFNIQLRMELFNVLNHANFAAPTGNATLFNGSGAAVSSAGILTSTTTTSRQIQFGAKVAW